MTKTHASLKDHLLTEKTYTFWFDKLTVRSGSDHCWRQDLKVKVNRVDDLREGLFCVIASKGNSLVHSGRVKDAEENETNLSVKEILLRTMSQLSDALRRQRDTTL